MKVLRRFYDESWFDALVGAAVDAGLSEATSDEMLEFFVEFAETEPEAEAAWMAAEKFGLLGTIEAAEPGPDLAVAA